MSGAPNKSFNLPWHQYDHYWISVFAPGGHFSTTAKQALLQSGLQAVAGHAMTIKTPRNWKSAWDTLYSNLHKANALGGIEVMITPGDDMPSFASSALERKSLESVQAIADSLWLGNALIEERILCYLQPVISSKDKVFGYESFARVKMENGDVVAGDKIVAASRALNIEYMIDRHLHVQAVKTFISSDFDGFLFINFFPGFIHRPSIYLEGLNSTAKSYGIVAKHLVLEFTQSETQHDINHMRNICEYARSCGYSIALDDIESLEGARKLVPIIRPDFLKIDMHLTRLVGEPKSRETIRQIVEFVHTSGGIVIAEGVETEDMRDKLRQLGIDLFQGYLFSPPMPVETVLKKTATKSKKS